MATIGFIPILIYAFMIDMLESIIRDGWTGTRNWTDKELQGALDEVLECNIVFEENVREATN